MKSDIAGLDPYAETSHQKNVLATIKASATIADAAIELDVSERNVLGMLARLRRKRDADREGYSSPPDSIIPPNHKIAGQSTQTRDANGNLVWVKTKEDPAAVIQDARQLFSETLIRKVKGKAKPVKVPKYAFADWMSGYIIGDAHFGMYAWGKETGANFDIEIAKNDLRDAITYLVKDAPKSEKGLLVNVGDFLHANDKKGITPGHGHILDVDGRYPRVAEIAAFTLKFAIEQMLKKHEHVEVINAPGNHDPDGGPWLSICLKMFYENEPRVTIRDSFTQAYYVRYGNNLVMVTHGDKGRVGDYIPTMATDCPEDWGETEHRYCWLGHYHHTEQKEHRGGYTEIFPTLAAPDAHAANNFYRSNREMHRIDVHREHGALKRSKVNKQLIDSIRAGAGL